MSTRRHTPEALRCTRARLLRLQLAVAGAMVTSECSRLVAMRAPSSTARSNASRFAFEGLLKPESLRTNCSEAARISSSLAGGLEVVERLDVAAHGVSLPRPS